MRRSRWFSGWSLGLLVFATLGTARAEGPATGIDRIPAPGTVPIAKSAPPAKMTLADITACMRANVVDRGSLRDVELRTIDQEQTTRTLRLKLFWKPEKDGSSMRSTLRVVEPTLHAGAAYLILSKPTGDEVYLYMPALDKVQRVSGDQDRSLFGTDFTQGDFKHVQQLLEKGEVTRLADSKVSERPVFMLETKTDLETTGYTRILSYVDQETCTLLKSEFFTPGGDPRKVLDADLSTLMAADRWWLILGYAMRDLKTNTRTELRLSDVYLLERLPEALFDPQTFYRAELQQ